MLQHVRAPSDCIGWDDIQAADRGLRVVDDFEPHHRWPRLGLCGTASDDQYRTDDHRERRFRQIDRCAAALQQAETSTHNRRAGLDEQQCHQDDQRRPSGLRLHPPNSHQAKRQAERYEDCLLLHRPMLFRSDQKNTLRPESSLLEAKLIISGDRPAYQLSARGSHGICASSMPSSASFSACSGVASP